MLITLCQRWLSRLGGNTFSSVMHSDEFYVICINRIYSPVSFYRRSDYDLPPQSFELPAIKRFFFRSARARVREVAGRHGDGKKRTPNVEVNKS